MKPRPDSPQLRPPRISEWSIRHPWAAMGLWLIVVAACVGVGFGVTGTNTADSGSQQIGDSGRADALIESAFQTNYSDEQILIRHPEGRRLDGAELRVVAGDVQRTLAEVQGVGRIEQPTLSDDGSAAVMGVRLVGTDAQVATTVKQTRELIDRIDSGTALRVAETGVASVEQGIEETLNKDFANAERLSLPITFVILLFVFGALVAALLPLALSLTAIVAAFGLAAMFSQIVPQTDALATILLLIGIAVGVDYSLFLVRRSRDERRRGKSPREAAMIAAATSGRAVVISGVTVVVAMAGMLLIPESTFQSMGVGAMLVVVSAMVGAITALPALLGVLGDRVDRGRVPLLSRLSGRNRGDRMWGAVARATVRRPIVAFVLSAGLLSALAVPALRMNMDLPSEADLPRSIPAMQTYDELTDVFPQDGSQHFVAVRVSDGFTATSPAVVSEVRNLQSHAAQHGMLIPSGGGVRSSADGSVVLVTLGYEGSETTPFAKRTLSALRNDLVPTTVGRVGTAYVTGFAAGTSDFTDMVRGAMPLIIAFVVALTLIVMLLSFRNVWIAGATVVLNLLSVAAAYGLLVLLFQTHRFDDILGVATNGAIATWLPPFMFVVLFGLSMDYHVFVLSRIREEYRAGHSGPEAIARGIGKTGAVISSAAAVMIAAFAIFATLSTIDMKQLGVGLSTAILIDATIVRGVLLPATLRLLGDRIWSGGKQPAPAPVAEAAA